MAKFLEQALGAIFMLLILLDVFLTVLYARMETGLILRPLSRGIWRLFRRVFRGFGHGRRSALSFGGPTILLCLLGIWAIGLALGAALILHPALGTAIQSGSGQTPHDFVTALFAAGSSLSIVGSGNFSPTSNSYKILYLFFSLVGLSVTSLTLTYLMQVYTALQQRNAMGLRMHLLSAETDDAAELITRLGPEGDFSGGYSILAELASQMSGVKEAHHLYPVLFFFCFDETYYSLSQVTLLAADTVSLMRSALDEEKLAWLHDSGAVTQLWHAARILATSLECNFLYKVAPVVTEPNARTLERWRGRYEAALRRLQQGGVPTTRDPRAGFEAYRSLRAQWDQHVAALATAMGYKLSDIDPIGVDPRMSDRRAPFDKHIA